MYQIDQTKFLTEEELDSLKRIIKNCRGRQKKNAVLIEFALFTGARAQEILNIERKDLNIADKSVLIRGIKGSRNREIPIPTDLFNKILEVNSESRDPNKIFDFKYRRLNKIWNEYRPVKKTFHSLRHTFAIQLYKKTKDIKLVQLCLGHVSLTSTNVYADFVYTTNEIRRLIMP